MEGVLVLGLLVLWMVLWVLMIRHERRRAAAGKARHGAARLLLASAALLTMMFLAGCVLLLVSGYPQWVSILNLRLIGTYVAAPFLVAAIAWWISMRRSAA